MKQWQYTMFQLDCIYEVYNTNACYGNALSLVATDNSSNTILNIIAPNQNGLNVKGGAYANDIERSMGIVDVSNVFMEQM